MRQLITALIASLALLAPLAPALAADTPPDLVRTVRHDKIGELLLPFDWKDEPISDGLRLISPTDDKGATAAIELAIVPRLPGEASIEALINTMMTETERSATNYRLLLHEPFEHNKRKGRRAELLMEEEGHLMHYLLIAVPWRNGVFLLSFGAPSRRYETLSPRSFLLAILDAIK